MVRFLEREITQHISHNAHRVNNYGNHLTVLMAKVCRSMKDDRTLKDLNLYSGWPHRQGGCLACCGCAFDSP